MTDQDKSGGNGSKDDDKDKPAGGTPNGAGPEKNRALEKP